jgi:integrase
MPAFVLLDHAGTRFPLTKPVYIREFRHRMLVAGIPDAQSFRGHSFRRGATTWAFQMGIPGEFIQIYGDWASDAYKSYLEFSMACKLHVAQKMRGRIVTASAFD